MGNALNNQSNQFGDDDLRLDELFQRKSPPAPQEGAESTSIVGDPEELLSLEGANDARPRSPGRNADVERTAADKELEAKGRRAPPPSTLMKKQSKSEGSLETDLNTDLRENSTTGTREPVNAPSGDSSLVPFLGLSTILVLVGGLGWWFWRSRRLARNEISPVGMPGFTPIRDLPPTPAFDRPLPHDTEPRTADVIDAPAQVVAATDDVAEWDVDPQPISDPFSPNPTWGIAEATTTDVDGSISQPATTSMAFEGLEGPPEADAAAESSGDSSGVAPPWKAASVDLNEAGLPATFAASPASASPRSHSPDETAELDRLTAELAAAQRVARDTQDQLAETQQELTKSAHQIQELETRSHESYAASQGMHRELDELRAQVQFLDSERDERKADIEAAAENRGQVDELIRLKTELSEKNASLEGLTATLQEEITGLKNDLAIAESTPTEIPLEHVQRFDKLEEQYYTILEERDRLLSEQAEAAQQHESADGSIRELEERVAEHEHTIHSLTEELDASRSAVSDSSALEDSLGAAQAKVTELEATIAERDSAISSLSQELANVGSQLETDRSSLAQVEDLQRAIALHESQVGALQDDLDAARTELATQRAETEEAQAELTTLQAESEAAQAELATLQAESEAAQGELAAQRADVEAAQAELATQRAEVEAAQGELATQRAEVEAAQAELAAQRANVEAAPAELAAQRADVEAAQAELATQRADVEAAQAELATQRADVEAAQAELATQRADVEAAQAELATQRANAEAAKTSLQSMEEQLGELAVLQQTVATLKQTSGEQVRHLESTIREQEEAIHRLNVEKEETLGRLYEASGRRDELDNQLRELQSRFDSADEQSQLVGTLQQRIAHLESDLAKFQVDSERLASEGHDTLEQLQSALQRGASLEASLRENEAQLALAQSDGDQLNVVREDLARQRERVAELEASIAERDQLLTARSTRVEGLEAELHTQREQLASVRQEQERNRQAIITLESEKERTLTDLRELQGEYRQRESLLNDAQAALTKAQAEVAAIVDVSARQTDEQISRLSTERDTAIRAWGAAEQRASDLRSVVREHEAALRRLEYENERVVRHLEELQSYRTQLEQSLKDVEHRLASRWDELASLGGDEAHIELQAELARLSRASSEAAHERQSAMEALDTARQRIRLLEEAAGERERSLVELAHERESLRALVQGDKSEAADGQLEDLHGQLAEAHRVIERLRQSTQAMEAASEEATGSTGTIRELRDALRQQEATVVRLQREVANRSDALEEEKVRRRTLASSLKRLKKQVATLEKEGAIPAGEWGEDPSLEKALKKATAKVTSLKAERKESSAALKRADERIAELKSLLAESGGKLKESQPQAATDSPTSKKTSASSRSRKSLKRKTASKTYRSGVRVAGNGVSGKRTRRSAK